MVRAFEQRLDATATSVRAARRAVTDRLSSLLDEERLDRAVLCTSEIVTNAIEHGAPPIELRIAETDGTVRIEVLDNSPLLPRRARPRSTSIRGRGLLIVERSADRWGVDEVADGKIVWFEFAF
jgi:anti-sigma regulatory factor (Ser/Thr protein kinase)